MYRVEMNSGTKKICIEGKAKYLWNFADTCNATWSEGKRQAFWKFYLTLFETLFSLVYSEYM